MKSTKEKRIEKFAEKVMQLSPDQFLGLCRYLKVKFLTQKWDENKKAICRDAEEIFYDVLNAFSEQSTHNQIFLLRQLKKEVEHGSPAKNRK